MNKVYTISILICLFSGCNSTPVAPFQPAFETEFKSRIPQKAHPSPKPNPADLPTKGQKTPEPVSEPISKNPETTTPLAPPQCVTQPSDVHAVQLFLDHLHTWVLSALRLAPFQAPELTNEQRAQLLAESKKAQRALLSIVQRSHPNAAQAIQSQMQQVLEGALQVPQTKLPGICHTKNHLFDLEKQLEALLHRETLCQGALDELKQALAAFRQLKSKHVLKVWALQSACHKYK